MGAIFKHRGDAIEHTPVADVTAGDVIVQGELIGVAKIDIKAGQLGALHVTGVFEVPRTTGGVLATGFKLYWDEANARATVDDAAGANAYLGKSVKESGDTDPTVLVRLEQ